LLADDAHATATTAIGCFDNNGEAVLVRELLDILKPLNRAIGTWDNWDIGGDSNLSGRDLVTKGIDRFGRRSDPLGEGRVS
jgi:hypothetical protein